MRAYMRDQFPFLGVPKPERAAALKPVLDRLVATGHPFDEALVLDLWALPEREYQYAACNYINRHNDQLTPEHLPLIERCVINKSWWDTTDSLFGVAGDIVGRFPEATSQMEAWSTDQNFWMRRLAILHQLRFKARTDQARLFRFIVANAEDDEFFIRKAIGWALRTYSATDPQAVVTFVNTHGELSNLSRREALKAIHRKAARRSA
jgi:3-methyladenine DNA glycosylase AlkD